MAGTYIKPEKTTVTYRQRRIFMPSLEDIRHAIMINKPDEIFLTFVNYITHIQNGQLDLQNFHDITRYINKYLPQQNVTWYGYGPHNRDWQRGGEMICGI